MSNCQLYCHLYHEIIELFEIWQEFQDPFLLSKLKPSEGLGDTLLFLQVSVTDSTVLLT